MIFWFAVAAVICLIATVVPLRVGLRKMESFEF
jgi:heme/copper-type cytochrome/quinol oxidase subunit 1